MRLSIIHLSQSTRILIYTVTRVRHLCLNNFRHSIFRILNKNKLLPQQTQAVNVIHTVKYHTVEPYNSVQGSKMYDLKDVVNKLKQLAPLHLAGSWDNVGLLVEPSAPKHVQKIMLTNDLTIQVMEEAKENMVDLIISYHPPIFVPLKRLTQSQWKERIVADCIESRIAVFSPHTSHDAVEGGVNDWLISAFGIEKSSVRPIEPTKEYPQGQSHILEVTLLDSARIKEVRDEILVSQLERDSRLRQNKEAFTTFPVKNGLGEEWKLQVACNKSELSSMLNGLVLSECSESYRVSELAKVPLTKTGMGRWAKLKSSITLQEAVQQVKSHLGVEHLMVAHSQDPGGDDIKTVAVCAGSGGSVLKGQTADLLVTGEMSHHEVLDAVHQGCNVILARHSNSERGYLHKLSEKIATTLGASVEVCVSETDSDPLVVV